MRHGDSGGPAEAGFLESLDSAGLAQYLEPFRSELRAMGLAVEQEPIGSDWFSRMRGALGAELNAKLRCGLEQIAALSTRDGFETLSRAAAERAVSLSPWRIHGRQNVALWCYLREREVFDDAYAALASLPRAEFHEFWGMRLVAELEPGECVLTEAAVLLERQFRTMGRSAKCRVRSRMDGQIDGSVLVIRHAPRACGAVGETSGAASTRADWRRQTEDFVIYDEIMDQVSICAQDPNDRELYRSALGMAVARDPAHYELWPVVCGEALLRNGPRLLDASEFPHFKRVRILGIRIMGKHGGQKIELGRGDDVGQMFEGLRAARMLEGATVMGWTMGVVLSVSPSIEMHVDCWSPNRLMVDARIPLPFMREFLLTKRLMIPPPGAARARRGGRRMV